MSECRNGWVRDLLPDVLHDQLDPATRLAVEAHIAGCPQCAGDLAMLERLRAAMSPVLDLDTDAIVAASAAAPAGGADQIASRVGHRAAWNRRRAPHAWRLAAGVATIAIGGAGLLYAARRVTAGSNVAVPPVAQEEASRQGPDASGRAAATGFATPPIVDELGLRMSALAELSDDDLERLLGDLERLEALPIVEPPALPALDIEGST